MSGLKVLPLQPWMKMINDEFYPKLPSSVISTGRNGWYMQEDYSWFECGNKTYKYDTSNFKYELYLLSIKVLTTDEFKACKYLYDRNTLTKGMCKVYNDNIVLHAIRVRKLALIKLKLKIKNRGKQNVYNRAN